ncbi:hypothetical protein Ciccas_001536 [Cichlidogyrus casuarinus]|uniref:Mitochondrial carrier protein n=1 Tax=Cichlidogyrus casuarinus TaxID=1844966 RepID=A0ABD2QJS6_9PLAT
MIDESTAHIIGGGIGGTTAAIITSPLEVVKVRLQSSGGAKILNSNLTSTVESAASATASKSLTSSWRRLIWLRTVADIANNEGKRALFKGLVPTILGVLPSRATYFYSYHSGQEFFGKYIQNNSSGIYLCSAIFGSLTASTLTSPIWYIKTRLQLDSGTGSKSLTVLKVIVSTYKENGIRGFYRGITASYVGSLETAINYVTYENLKAHLLSWDRRRKRRTRDEQGQSLIDCIESLRDKREYLVNKQMELLRIQLREEVHRYWWMPMRFRSSKPEVVKTQEIIDLDRKLIPLEEQLNLFLMEENEFQSTHQTADLRGSTGGSKMQSFSDMLLIGLASCCSKGIAITIAYPHEVVRTRLREPSGRYHGFVGTLVKIVNEDGLRGLYRGLATHYIRQIPNSGIMMGTYEGVIFALQYWGLMRVNGVASDRETK